MAAGCAAVLGVLLAVAAGPAQAATASASPGPAAHALRAAQPADGSLLLDETFTGTQVDDPGFLPLNDACLTGAAAEPPPGVSPVGPCDGETQTTEPVPTAGETPGYLQLTDSGYYRRGGMLYNRPLPFNGGLQVTFDQYQYGTSPSPAGADGIGFFLVDGATDLTAAGGDGGSLGYAQRNLDPGVAGGYVGVGLDAYGNFANDFENRGNGCPEGQRSPVTVNETVPNTVTLRGPGEGIEGYCFLESTMEPDASTPSGFSSTLPGSLREQGTEPEPALRTVRVTVSPDALPTVDVEIDFQDGNGFQTVISEQLTEEAPPTYKFGFSASTGGFFDTHLIRNARATSVTELDNLNLVKTVVGDHPEPYEVGETVDYEFLVTNTGTTELTGVGVDDPEVDDISCPEDTLGPAGTPTATMVCTGSHVITEEDAAAGSFTNTAVAEGANPEGDPVVSNESSATVPVEEPVPPVTDLEIDKQVSPDVAEPGDEVTYTLSVTNNGDAAVDPAVVTDDLSGVLDDATLVGEPTADTGEVGVEGSTLTWSGALEPGETATITYTVAVDDPDEGDRVLVNSVTSTTPGAHCADGGELPCTTEVPVTVPGLSLEKSVVGGGTEPYEVGDTVEYEFLVTNTGATELTGVGVDDPELVDVSCPEDTLEPGDSMVCTGSHVITEEDAAAGSFTNTAVAEGTDPEGDPVDSNESSATVPVEEPEPPVTDLEIDKQVSANRVEPGDEVTYTLSVTNNGDTAVDPAVVTDDLSGVLDDATLVGDPTADTGEVSVEGSTLTWSGVLEPGQTATITYTVAVDDPDEGDQVLVNSVTSTTPGAHCAGGGELPCTTEVIVDDRTDPCPPKPCDCCCQCCCGHHGHHGGKSDRAATSHHPKPPPDCGDHGGSCHCHCCCQKPPHGGDHPRSPEVRTPLTDVLYTLVGSVPRA